ncbi:MAG: 4Fe-4S binding protein [Planctomycetes bacterium]|nr:4Fe-4S binding protein [Planctomycetota bacterium]
MSLKWKIPWRIWRRLTQIGFLLFFLWLFRRTEYDGIRELPAAVTFFFRVDPLVAASATLAAKQVIAVLWPALVTIVLTVILGRFFCGWVCPLGTLLDGAHRLIPARVQPPARSWRKVKYFLLGLILAGALLGLPLVGYFDPFAILFRGLAFAVDPFLNGTIRSAFDWLYKTAPEGVTAVSESVYSFLKAHVLAISPNAYYLAGVSFMILAAVFVLERLERRFWCRNLCPLGALLAVFGRFSFLRRIPFKACPDCSRCQTDCRMGVFDHEGGRMSPEGCNLCLDCVDDCPKGIARFSFRRPRVAPAPFDPSRRLWLGATGVAVIGAAAVSMDRNKMARAARGSLLRPPGAIRPGVDENDFLELCVRCGKCLKVCPTNVIQPALLESGWEGIFSPRMATRLGYCEYNCTLCGEVCPTGALPRLTEEEKHEVVLGKAEFDTSRCLPYARAENCLVCEEHCPVPDKAIRVRDVEMTNTRGEKVTVQQPYVEFDLCIGCGICENKCPLPGAAGIRVLPADEARVMGESAADGYGY